MRALMLAAATVLVAMALASAVGADGPERPPGVSADEWVPLSPSLGVVLVHEPDPFLGKTGAGPSQGAAPAPDGRNVSTYPGGPTDLLVPTIPLVRSALEHSEAAAGEPLHGYLVVRQGKHWRRLVVSPQ